MKHDHLPVIDVTKLDDPRALMQLEEACRDWGFFNVVGHGMDEEILGCVLHQAHLFFARPPAMKREVARTLENFWGYYDQELTKNTRDWKEVYDYGPENRERGLVPQWPSGMPGFRAAITHHYQVCERLALRLLDAIARNLGTTDGSLREEFGPGNTSFLRLNYYPVCPVPERPEGESEPRSGHLGVNRHTDAGALTLLLQDDQPGLEVLKDGRWQLVPPLRGALTVNVGDIVQVWSNDRYKAALHRVIASEDADRYSVPYFFSPRYETDYGPLAGTVSARRPARYRPINWGEFRRKRADGDYSQFGKEIQIDDYRIA